MARQKHLSLSDRSVIETGLNRCASRTSIAEILNMDKSSICKEIKKHAFFKKKSSYGRNSHGTYDCLHLEKCGFKSFCTHACSERCPIPCKRKDALVVSVTVARNRHPVNWIRNSMRRRRHMMPIV